ncbi:hypothetical protein G6F59_016951 [Rhizopus arrhizus]|nr:hypothetical protein G6F59_016951 [Rhizopus arrhizus]
MAMATLDGRQGAVHSTRQLAELAQAVVITVLAMAEADMRAAHGEIPGGRFAIIGYGSLGGLELGFAMVRARWSRGAGTRGWHRR